MHTCADDVRPAQMLLDPGTRIIVSVSHVI